MSDPTTYLQQEVAKSQRTQRTALIAMGAVLVIFIGYFEWLKAELRTILTPDSVAEFAINQARAILPDITESLKSNLRSEAPEVVRFVLHQGVDTVLPLAAQSFESNLEEYTRDVSATGGDHVNAALEAVLRGYKANTRLAKNQDKALFATRLAAEVEAQLGNKLDSVAKDQVQQRLDRTGETLKRINQELTVMAHRPSADREGELGKRLITTWWSFLDRGRPKEDGAAVAAPVPAKKSSAAPAKK